MTARALSPRDSLASDLAKGHEHSPSGRLARQYRPNEFLAARKPSVASMDGRDTNARQLQYVSMFRQPDCCYPGPCLHIVAPPPASPLPGRVRSSER